MKFNDDITMAIAASAKDVIEGKVKQEVKEMDPKKHVSKNGDKFDVVNSKGKVVKSFDNEDDANKYATDNHDDLMVEVEEPRAKGEKDFKDKHVVKKSGEKEDGTVVKEKKEVKEDDVDDSEAKISKEESEKQKKYQAFFAKALKKFGVKSPNELEGDKKKEFFDYIDANYEADKESD